MLTSQMLKDLEPGALIGQGITHNDSGGIYMTDHRRGDKLKWVALRGRGYHDWTIYCGWEEESWEKVETLGQKVSGKENIQKLVECDDEALALYRR